MPAYPRRVCPLEEHSHVRCRSPGGRVQRAFERLSVSQEHGQTGRQGFRSVSYVYGSTWKVATPWQTTVFPELQLQRAVQPAMLVANIIRAHSEQLSREIPRPARVLFLSFSFLSPSPDKANRRQRRGNGYTAWSN